MDAGNADALSRSTGAESAYAALVTRFGGSVASLDRQTSNQEALTNQVDDEREQMAGVNLDEETVNLVSAQHAYEAASKVMTVLDSVLDTLINRTGVTH
jgi:flagellar hook-associated protein 1 FlgK